MKRTGTRIISLLLIAAAPGCTSTNIVTVDELRATSTMPATFVLTDGGKVRYEQGYTVLNDTILGFGLLLRGGAQTSSTRPDTGVQKFRTQVALSEVKIAEITEFSTTKTVLFVGAVTAAVLVAVTVASSSDDQAPPPVRSTSTSMEFSCPFIFTDDGDDYRCESETFAGSVVRGLERTATDPLPHLAPVNGRYRLLLVNARKETEYVDELNLLLVDHPPSVRPVPDAHGALHTVGSLSPASAAVDFAGNDALASIAEADGRMWQSDLAARDFRNDVQYRDGLFLEFDRPPGSHAMKLLVAGKNTRLGYFALRRIFEMKGEERLQWYERLESDPAEASRFTRWLAREGMLHVSVWRDGAWVRQAVLMDVGPGVLKEQVALLDLAGITGPTVKVKLETATDLWRIDRVGVDFSADLPVAPRRITPLTAVDERGADVVGLLEKRDGTYYVTTGGMFARLEFDAPAPEAGLARTVLAATTGFYHQWHSTLVPADPAAVDRILDEPLYGRRRLMGEWLKERDRYEGTLPADLPPMIEDYLQLTAR